MAQLVSETYTLVSEKYLMERVSSLGCLLAMETDQPSLAVERATLAEGCDVARKAVKELVLEKKAKFERGLEARAEAIEKEMRAVLPAIGDAKKQLRELSLEEESKFM